MTTCQTYIQNFIMASFTIYHNNDTSIPEAIVIFVQAPTQSVPYSLGVCSTAVNIQPLASDP